MCKCNYNPLTGLRIGSRPKILVHMMVHLILYLLDLYLNLNSLLVTYQMTLFHQGFAYGKNLSPESISEANLDEHSSDISAVENRESGRSFQSLMVWGKKLHL